MKTYIFILGLLFTSAAVLTLCVVQNIYNALVLIFAGGVLASVRLYRAYPAPQSPPAPNTISSYRKGVLVLGVIVAWFAALVFLSTTI